MVQVQCLCVLLSWATLEGRCSLQPGGGQVVLYSPLPRVTSWKDKYTLDPRHDIRCWQMVAPEQVAVFL